MATKKSISLGDLENRLNKDEKLQAEFLKDPVAVLKREGMELTPDLAKSVKEQFDDIRVKKMQTLAKKPRITIRIVIHF